MMDVLSLIPQRPPFVFVEKVVGCNTNSATIQYTIRDDCPLLENGHELSTAGLMEHVAQSCATFIGAQQVEKHLPIKIGYIGGVKKLEVLKHPRVGEVITTDVTISQQVFNISQMDCITKLGSDEIARTSIKLALEE